MAFQTNKSFNTGKPHIMYVDFNSCFASIEQQANPLLIGKPIAVLAYDKPTGCILTPSREAKKFGIKTGMRFSDGLKLCPNLIPISTDPDKYRFVHKALRRILDDYSPSVTPRSIDEFAVDFSLSPHKDQDLVEVGLKIKSRIKEEIGDFLTVSIGISTNHFLAKLASNLHKPDGLEVIDHHNYLDVYQKLNLIDLPGVAEKTANRLACFEVKNVLDFYQTSLERLSFIFHSVHARYWYERLRGWEVDQTWSTKSIGHEFSLPHDLKKPEVFPSVLMKICEKVAIRLRQSRYSALGIHVGIFSDAGYFHESHTLPQPVFTGPEIFRVCLHTIPQEITNKVIRKISVTCFSLQKLEQTQLDLFGKVDKNYQVSQALDSLTNRYGRFVVSPATMAYQDKVAPDAIGFGKGFN